VWNHQNWWFSEFHAALNANVRTFLQVFFLNLTLCMTKLRVPVLSFPDLTLRISLMSWHWYTLCPIAQKTSSQSIAIRKKEKKKASCIFAPISILAC
jgi:hypothetical protein